MDKGGGVGVREREVWIRSGQGKVCGLHVSGAGGWVGPNLHGARCKY